MSDPIVPVSLPAREIAPPPTVSAAAQAVLSRMAAAPPSARPDPADEAGWRAAIAASEAFWHTDAEAIIGSSRSRIEETAIGGVPCTVASPPGADDRALLFFHGGAFVFGGGLYARAQAPSYADRLRLATISPDYRMPPDHPFPAAPEDGLAVYLALLERHAPSRIVIGGSSAGGNLAAAVALMIRDRGLPLPAGLILLTPEVDLTEAGDSFRTNALLDVVLKGPLPECNLLYAGGRPLDDPGLSPLMADLAGLPPMLIQAGTRDLFLSNAALFHRKARAAGVAAELHVWEAMPHGGFGGGTPEDADLDAELARFVARICPPSLAEAG